MTPEGKIKQWLRKQMKERFPDALHYAPPGGRFGKAGMPDDMWFIPSGNPDICVVVAIESKVEGNTPTQLQMKHLKHLKLCGCISAVMTDKDKVKLEKIYNEVLRRIQLANEKPESQTLCPPGGDSRVFAS